MGDYILNRIKDGRGLPPLSNDFYNPKRCVYEVYGVTEFCDKCKSSNDRCVRRKECEDKQNMNRTYNDVIESAGLYYIGHFNECSIRICGRKWGITIPVSRAEELTNIFPEMRWEDGEYIESLKGKYVRVTDDGFHVISISNIIENLTFYVMDTEWHRNKSV